MHFLGTHKIIISFITFSLPKMKMYGNKIELIRGPLVILIMFFGQNFGVVPPKMSPNSFGDDAFPLDNVRRTKRMQRRTGEIRSVGASSISTEYPPQNVKFEPLKFAGKTTKTDQKCRNSRQKWGKKFD